MSEDDRTAPSREAYGDKYQDHVLELYKLSVEMADRNTQRRITATSSDVLLVANTLVAALAAAGQTATNASFRGLPTIVLGVSGLLLCVAWGQRVNSYRALASAKFSVIVDFERLLPLDPYRREWQAVADRQWPPRRWHTPRIDVELLLPWLFAALHAALIVVALIRLS